MSKSAWEVLGVEETCDAKAIRRAYATALKRTRPDEDAEGFQLLTDAYEWAQGYARHMLAQAQAQAAEGEVADRLHEAGGEGSAAPVAARGGGNQAQDLAPASTGQELADNEVASAANEVTRAETELAQNAQEQSSGYSFAPFFDELSAQVRDRNPAVLREWLASHPDLYSIELKWALMPHVFDALAHAAIELDPHRGHIHALMEFFGVDARLRQHPSLAPPLNYLEAGAWRNKVQVPEPKMPEGWNDFGAAFKDKPRKNLLRMTPFERFKARVVEIALVVFALAVFFFYIAQTS